MFMFSYNATSTGLVLVSLKTMHSMIFIEKIILNINICWNSSTPLQKSMSFVLNNTLEDQISSFLSKARSIYCSGFTLK